MDIRKTCLTCGSGKASKVLSYCNKCKECVQHIYCLENRIHNGRIWYCDDCQGVKPPASFSTHDLDDCEPMDTEDHEEVTQSSPPSAMKSSTPFGTNQNLKAKKTEKSGSVEKRILETILEDNEEVEGDGTGCDDGHKLGKDQECHVLEEEATSCFKNLPFLKKKKHVAAQQVEVPTCWKGSLNILDKVDNKNLINETISGFAAHLSSFACDEVLEKSKFLKAQLVTDLVRRTDVWPKGYAVCETSYQSIALYFFPDSETDGKDFNNLVVRMMQEDLDMRVNVEKAELLVFTSSMLAKITTVRQRCIYGESLEKSIKTFHEWQNLLFSDATCQFKSSVL